MNSEMVVPMLVCLDAGSEIAFCEAAFGAIELSRRSSQNGSVVHATLKIGKAMIMVHGEAPHLMSRAPRSDGSSSVVIYIYVEEVDAAIERAKAAGARVLIPAANQFWGDRVGRIVDPAGHVWNVATRVSEKNAFAAADAPVASQLQPGALGGASLSVFVRQTKTMSQPDASAARLQFLGVYRLVPRLYAQSAWTRADEDAVQQHFARLQTAARQGKVILAGRTLEEKERTFGIVVFEASNENEARAFLDSDPTVLAGVMTCELHPYRVAVSR